MVVVAGVGGSVLGSVAFPRETLVDRPVEVIIEKEVPVEKVVEKTVERPVEVVKLVEKPVPAQLTPAQTSAIEFARKAFDFNSAIQGPALIKLSDKVVVLVDIEGDGASRFSHSEIRTEVENAFRLQGFRVLPAGSKEYPYTVATVSGIYLENRAYAGQVLSISGAYEISLRQPVIYFNSANAPDVSQTKFYIGEVPLYRQSGTLNYGSSNFDKVPGVYAKMAATAASELRKAMDSR
jgi:hypothetical protein